MTRAIRITLLPIVPLLLLASGCSEKVPEERTDAQCTDGIDNDGDGLLDCADPDCRARPICAAHDGGIDALSSDLRLPAESRVTEFRAADRGVVDTIVPVPEKEPNDGKTQTDFMPITLPIAVRAAIGVADDIDVFSWDAAAGDRLTATVKSDGTLQPHLAVFGEQSLKVPAAVSTGTGQVMAEYYVLKTGRYFIGVRDLRNVGPSPAHVGGPTFTYTLTVAPLSRPPVPATVGGEVKGDLSPPGTVGVFSFDTTSGTNLQIEVLANRLTPSSSLDSRLSLFHPGQKAWLGTNDNISGSETDSLLKGPLPFTGTYHAIVENEGTAVSNLGFVLKISKLP